MIQPNLHGEFPTDVATDAERYRDGVHGKALILDEALLDDWLEKLAERLGVDFYR